MRGLCISDSLPTAGALKPEVPGASGLVPIGYGACSTAAAAGSSPLPVMGNSVPAECMLCSEVTFLIYFDPCGHGVVCEECCIRMKKCVSCQQVIHRKVNRFGQSISAENRTSNTNVKAVVGEPPRYNENMCAEIEEAYYCPICMERRRNIVFLCGHGACEKCADALSKCHMCRTPIKQKINLY
jgi:E3 ubiquitin-protein ligase mind-bomb